MACGAGLFSDGYLQAVIGPVNTILQILYPDTYANSRSVSNVTSIAFAGTVVGQLVLMDENLPLPKTSANPLPFRL
jgi:hypothetical protein